MEEHVPLSQLTTFRIGGPARYFFRVKNTDEAREAFSFARQQRLPFFILGGGSNLLASDDGFRGVVIKNEFLGREFENVGDDVLATIGAGESWDGFVEECVNRGLYGVENLSGIPGTVGAAPVQNIGAYGSEVKDTLLSVEAFDTVKGVLTIFSNEDCLFLYRDSFFKTKEGKRYIITAVSFRLKKNGTLNLGYKDLKNFFGESDSSFPKGGPPATTTLACRAGGRRPEDLNPSPSRTRVLPFTKGELPTLEGVRRAVLEIRKGKFPDLKTTGTAGSFFKNPIISKTRFDELKKKFPDLPGFPVSNSPFVKGSTESASGGISKSSILADSATRPTRKRSRCGRASFRKGGIKTEEHWVKLPLAWILDNILHYKGLTFGAVGLHEAQPLVVVNRSSGTATDVRRLAEDIAQKVREATGIQIAWEVEFL